MTMIKPPVSKSIRFLAYGSLRKGEYNYAAIGKDSLKYIGEYKLAGYTLYSLGSYPAIVYSGKIGDVVVCDILETNEEISREIDCMEILAGYYVDSIKVGESSCKYYCMSIDDINSGTKVQSGDWLKRNI